MPRFQTILSAIGQFIAVCATLTPIVLWGLHTMDARAQEYVNKVIAPTVADMNRKIESQTGEITKLTAAINNLLKGQKTEATQSIDEALVGRKILCLQERLADPTSHTEEECDSIR